MAGGLLKGPQAENEQLDEAYPKVGVARNWMENEWVVRECELQQASSSSHPFTALPISQRRRIPSSAYAAQIDSQAAAAAAAQQEQKLDTRQKKTSQRAQSKTN